MRADLGKVQRSPTVTLQDGEQASDRMNSYINASIRSPTVRIDRETIDHSENQTATIVHEGESFEPMAGGKHKRSVTIDNSDTATIEAEKIRRMKEMLSKGAVSMPKRSSVAYAKPKQGLHSANFSSVATVNYQTGVPSAGPLTPGPNLEL